MKLAINGENKEILEAQKEDLKQTTELQRVMNLMPLLSDEGYQLKALPAAKVDGKDVVGIQVSSKNLKDTKIYFSKDTNLMTKIERKGLDPSNNAQVEQEMYLSDYKDVQGVKKPMKTVMNNDGKKFIESVNTKMELTEKIDDKEFGD